MEGGVASSGVARLITKECNRDARRNANMERVVSPPLTPRNRIPLRELPARHAESSPKPLRKSASSRTSVASTVEYPATRP